MKNTVKGLWVLAWLGLSAPAAAQSPTDMWFADMCGREGGMIEHMQRRAEYDGLDVVRDDERYVAYATGKSGAVLILTKPEHEAYPSIACRKITKHKGGKGVSTEMQCGDGAAGCDAMLRELQESDALKAGMR